jgi:hypothetical protein
MQRLLTTPHYEGYFDFFSNLVVLNCYEARHLREIQDALAWTAAVGTPPNPNVSSSNVLFRNRSPEGSR